MSFIYKLAWHQKLLLKKDVKVRCQFFQQQGYLGIDEKYLLHYVLFYRWKRQMPSTFKLCREDILTMNVNDFFDYQQIQAQTSPITLEDWSDMNDLF